MIYVLSGSPSLYAVIAVTYPAGSICTCGGKSAKDTSGYALFNVKAGTYTVECHTSDGSKSKSVSVTVAESDKGQVKNVTLAYELVLYNAGDECTAVTGGWQSRGLPKTSGGEYAAAPTLTKGSTTLKGAFEYGHPRYGVVEIIKDVDLTHATTLYLDCEYTIQGDSDASLAYISLLAMPRSTTYLNGASANLVIKSGNGTIIGSRQTYSLSIANLSGLFDIAVGLEQSDSYNSCSVTIHKCWFS